MKKKLVIISLALAILFGIGYKNQAEAYTTVSFSLFFDALAPYGNWVSVPTYGNAWQPSDIGSDWRPYTNGQWVWTDDGWTWISYEPWGWAPYHYGRWIFTDDYGWVWVPGTKWAPAWVTWYTGLGYIGWTPLPPDNNFSLEIGIGPIAFSYYTQPSYAVFVPANSFMYSNVNSVAIPTSQNITIIKNTTTINNITVVNNRVINNGPGVSIVEKATGVKVQKVNVVERNMDPVTVTNGHTNINKLEGKNFYVYRPSVVKKGDETPHLLKREPAKGSEINQSPAYQEGKVSKPPNQQDLKIKGGEINQPPVYQEGKVNIPPNPHEVKKNGGPINQPPPYKEGEFDKPSKQQVIEKKPVTKGTETERATAQEKKKEIKPLEQKEQKKKEEQ